MKCQPQNKLEKKSCFNVTRSMGLYKHVFFTLPSTLLSIHPSSIHRVVLKTLLLSPAEERLQQDGQPVSGLLPLRFLP